VEYFASLREKYGPGVDIGVEFHGAVQPQTALLLMKALEPYQPFFYEEPVQALNVDIMAELARKTHIPIATGERIFTKWGFKEILEKRAATILQPDVCYAGGITELKKIAALCETHYVGMIPHFTGPISTAALVHVLASSSGFVMTEITKDAPTKTTYLNDDYLSFKNGKLYPNERPGLGVEFSPKNVELVNVISEPSEYDHPMFHRSDGSVTNW